MTDTRTEDLAVWHAGLTKLRRPRSMVGRGAAPPGPGGGSIHPSSTYLLTGGSSRAGRIPYTRNHATSTAGWPIVSVPGGW